MKRDKNMIIIQLNRQIFEYDVHSLVKSFYPGEDVKIVYETSPEEADAIIPPFCMVLKRFPTK